MHRRARVQPKDFLVSLDKEAQEVVVHLANRQPRVLKWPRFPIQNTPADLLGRDDLVGEVEGRQRCFRGENRVREDGLSGFGVTLSYC